MYKIPRFDSFRSANEAEEDKAEKDWQQRITLPLPPSLYREYAKQASEPQLVSKSAKLTSTRNNARLGNEHILSALGDLMRAMDLDGKEVIDYILANDLVKGESTDEP